MKRAVDPDTGACFAALIAQRDREAGDTDNDDDGTDGDERKAKPSQATQLVELAQERYHLGITEAGEAFAILKDGPNLAVAFRGGRSSLGAALAKTYFDTHGRAPTAAARADALTVLEGMAGDLDPTEPWLRVAPDGDSVVVDLGTADGAAVVIDRDGYRVVEGSPVLFRRTALTLPLPRPVDKVDSFDPSILRDCGMNLGEREQQLLMAALVAMTLPDIPHPVIALFGEQGTGKSTAGKMIGLILDQSSAPLRAAPRNEEQWQVQAAGSWVVVLDNLSGIQPWLSDALCRAVTGDGSIKRTLYSNSDLSVLSFRRCIVLTSIDAGVLRGDLAERLLPLELERIDPTRRRTDADTAAAFAKNHPRILGMVCALTAKVLAVLPDVHLDELPRMADFAKILAAVDEVTGWDTLGSFLGVGTQLADDVVDADPVASAIVKLAEQTDSWSGTATQLLERMTTDELARRRDWPKSPQALSGAVKRCATALRTVGVDIAHGDTSSTRRTWFVTRTEIAGNRSSTLSTLSTSSTPSNGTKRTNSGPDDLRVDDMDKVDDLSQLCSVCHERPAGSFTDRCHRCIEADAR